MTDAVLRDRLLATVPALDDSDWLDVRRRARAIEASRRRNRRLLAIAAVLAIVAALVVNPALGIGERLLDFVEGDPAPEDIKQSIRRTIPYGRFVLGQRVLRFEGPAPPDVPRAHLAIRLESSMGPVYFWVAPAGGGACTRLEIVNLPDRRGGAFCDSAPTVEHPITNFQLGPSQVGERTFNFIAGRVGSEVTRLEVDLSDGRVPELRLVERFFLAELPTYRLSQRSTGCLPLADPRIVQSLDPSMVSCYVVPTEFRGLGANGRLVMRLFGMPSTLPKTARDEQRRRAISIRLRSGRWVRIETGGGCWYVLWDTGLLDVSAMNGSCSPVKDHDLPSRMLYGSPVDNRVVLLHGPVGPDIARVDLVWSDGTRERLKLENGFVLKEIDPAGDRRPAKLVGRDESGRVAAEEAVR
jgi:hypothetical protein